MVAPVNPKQLIALATSPCPLCGSDLQEVPATTFDTYAPSYHVKGRALPTRERQTVIAACTGCELIIDLHRPDGVPKTSAQILHDVGMVVRKHQNGQAS